MLKSVTIIGGGPTGLMAADILSQHNYSVTVFERKPSLGRKFLLAGRGGLNITHSENTNDFLKKYGNRNLKNSNYYIHIQGKSNLCCCKYLNFQADFANTLIVLDKYSFVLISYL